MDLYNAMKQARKYYAEKNHENALEIFQQCFDFAKQEYEKGDKRGLDFLLNGDPYDKKLDYEKALRINREAYSLCQMILSCFNDIRRHLCFYYSLDGCDLRFLENRYNTYFEKTIKQQEKSEQEFKFLLKRKDEED